MVFIDVKQTLDATRQIYQRLYQNELHEKIINNVEQEVHQFKSFDRIFEREHKQLISKFNTQLNYAVDTFNKNKIKGFPDYFVDLATVLLSYHISNDYSNLEQKINSITKLTNSMQIKLWDENGIIVSGNEAKRYLETFKK